MGDIVVRCRVAGGGPVRQPYSGINFIPPGRGYEFGYSRFYIVGTSEGIFRGNRAVDEGIF